MALRRVLGVATMVALSTLVTGCAGSLIDEVIDETVGTTGYDCDALADEAVRISEEQGGFVTLLKVRSPQVVEDNRDSYETPAGDGEAVIMVCEGTGVWSDSSRSGVRLRWTIDADGDEWVIYKPIN